jgi:hypothetical protein
MRTDIENATQVKITFSSEDHGDVVHEFVLLTTNAPDHYDSFGTITLVELPAWDPKTPLLLRYVLQPVQHVEYYRTRVSSGLYWSEFNNDLSDNDVCQRLFKRMTTFTPEK